MLEGIRHPSFQRVSPTRYTLGSDHDYRYIIHVGQIVEFLDFDQTLRNGRKVMKSSEIPLGYEQFADLFNDGAHPKDKRRFSTLTYVSTRNGPPIIEKSTHPVTAHCFRITTSQCGLETSNPFGVSDEQALLILGQFASSSAEEKVKKTNFALERVEKRKAITKATFEKQPEQPPKKRKRDNKQRKHYFDNPDESTASFDDDLQIIGSESFFLDSLPSPHVSTSGQPTASTSLAAITPVAPPSSSSTTQITLANNPADEFALPPEEFTFAADDLPFHPTDDTYSEGLGDAMHD